MAAPVNQLAALAAMLKPNPKEAEYYETFGRFIAAYSNAETGVHRLIRHLSGTDDQKARILLGGLSLKDVSNRLRGIVTINKYRTSKGILFPMGSDSVLSDEIESCLDQLAIITEKRHRLIHRSLSYTEEGFRLTDIFTSRHIVNFETNTITLQDLKLMSFDVLVISLSLNDVMRNPGEPPYWDDQNPRPPWRYKPPEQVPQKAKPKKDRQAQKRQQRALRVKRDRK